MLNEQSSIIYNGIVKFTKMSYQCECNNVDCVSNIRYCYNVLLKIVCKCNAILCQNNKRFRYLNFVDFTVQVLRQQFVMITIFVKITKVFLQCIGSSDCRLELAMLSTYRYTLSGLLPFSLRWQYIIFQSKL